MSANYILKTASEIAELKQSREVYKKHFWLHANSLDQDQRRLAKKLFMKIDRLRNHLKLWLKYMVRNKPVNYSSYMLLIERGKAEVHSSFKQLDKVLYDAA